MGNISCTYLVEFKSALYAGLWPFYCFSKSQSIATIEGVNIKPPCVAIVMANFGFTDTKLYKHFYLAYKLIILNLLLGKLSRESGVICREVSYFLAAFAYSGVDLST